jgi:hypothetical protein
MYADWFFRKNAGVPSGENMPPQAAMAAEQQKQDPSGPQLAYRK